MPAAGLPLGHFDGCRAGDTNADTVPIDEPTEQPHGANRENPNSGVGQVRAFPGLTSHQFAPRSTWIQTPPGPGAEFKAHIAWLKRIGSPAFPIQAYPVQGNPSRTNSKICRKKD